MNYVIAFCGLVTVVASSPVADPPAVVAADPAAAAADPTAAGSAGAAEKGFFFDWFFSGN